MSNALLKTWDAAEKIERAFSKMGLEASSYQDTVWFESSVDVPFSVIVHDEWNTSKMCDFRADAEEWFKTVITVADKMGLKAPGYVLAIAKKARLKEEKASALPDARKAMINAIAERESVIAAWKPEEWAKIADIPGKKARKKRREYRRAAEAALGLNPIF